VARLVKIAIIKRIRRDIAGPPLKFYPGLGRLKLPRLQKVVRRVGKKNSLLIAIEVLLLVCGEDVKSLVDLAALRLKPPQV
jgi:hypothetical protein